jgi:hypothetical protein
MVIFALKLYKMIHRQGAEDAENSSFPLPIFSFSALSAEKKKNLIPLRALRLCGEKAVLYQATPLQIS